MKALKKALMKVFKKKIKCKKCGSRNIIMIEYDYSHPEHYDGISEIQCGDCHARFGRWSGKELKEGESEKKFGGK
jgi:transcription elongation factor Elf1